MEGGRAMNTELFCTPDQGRRLAELVPELQSVFVWASLQDGSWFIIEQRSITDGAFVEFRPTFAHAITLQELRDVVSKLILDHMGKGSASIDNDEFEYNLSIMTAPNLAAWIIERLEGTP
jgi:hypothetical protein